MITAKNLHSFATGARTWVLAGSLVLSTVLPTAAIVSADAGSGVSTPAANQPVLTEAEAFDVDPAGGLIDIQAVVVANEEGAPLLQEPTENAEVVESLPAGSEVVVRIDDNDTVYSDDGATRWWPVDVGGSSGWVDGRSLMSPEDYAARSASASSDGTDAGTTATTRQPFDYTGELDGATAQVDADGEGLVMRAEPAAGSEAVVSLSEGTIVDLRIADVDTVYDTAGTRWWPVSYEGNEGWVSGFYLITPGTTPQTGTTTESTTTSPSDVAPTGDFAYIPGDWAVVRTDDGGRTNLFESPDASSATTATIPNMALVEVIAQADGEWYEVRWDTNQGFISGELLTAGTAPRRAGDAVDPAPTPTPASVSTEAATQAAPDPIAPGDVAKIDSESDAGVNVRAAAGSDAESTGFLNDDAQVTVIAGPTEGTEGDQWFEVETEDGVSGWVRADLLVRVVASTDNATEASTQTSDAGFILPVTNYRFTQDFGCSNLGFYGYDANWGCSVHDGLDLAATAGTPIQAVADGTVVVAGWSDSGFGYYVEIDHGNGVHSLYGHMIGQPSVTVGQEVKQGDQIGQVGSTGLSTGPHVHVMVRENGVTVDPKKYLPPVRENASNAGN